MSAQAGVFDQNGKLVTPDLISQLRASLHRQSPEGTWHRATGSVAMVYGACHITPESVTESQPMEGADRSLMTWDGRLDNRQHLLDQVGDLLKNDHSDGAIAHAAFRRWKHEAAARLIGDWAFAVWDASARTLYLSRDFAGACPLYYSTGVVGLFLWSSELEELQKMTARLSGKSLKLNQQWVATYLSMTSSFEVTPILSIHPVLPGHIATVTWNSVTSRRYWEPDPGMSIRYRNDFEYEEHFLSLLRESVRCRLRSRGPVWAHLSGGLDSSWEVNGPLGRPESLLGELRPLWERWREDLSPRIAGVITKILPNGNAGFIHGEDKRDFYFDTRDWREHKSKLSEGIRVTFATKPSFDRKHQRPTVVACDVRVQSDRVNRVRG